MRQVAALLAALCLWPAPPAGAQEGGFDQARLVQVQPGTKRYFFVDYPDGCPAITPKCRRRAYAMPGDQLVAFEASGALTRVAYTTQGGRTTEGWIETVALRPLASLTPTPESWLGAWTVSSRGWDASLTITRSATPGRVRIEGGVESGTDDPWRVEHGAIHIGLFSAEVEVSGRLLAFATGDTDEPGAVRVVPQPEEGDGEEGTLPYNAPSNGPYAFGDDRCRIRMRLIGPYLLVEDNRACGAQGATFSGAYRR